MHITPSPLRTFGLARTSMIQKFSRELGNLMAENGDLDVDIKITPCSTDLKKPLQQCLADPKSLQPTKKKKKGRVSV
jgi:hypothetical protein